MANNSQHRWILPCCVRLHTLLLVAAYCWELLHPFAHHHQHGHNDSQHCWPTNVGSCCSSLHTTTNTDTTTSNIVGPPMLGVAVSVCTPLPTRTQRLPTLLAHQCWELLHPFAHHYQHGHNNSQHCWPTTRWHLGKSDHNRLIEVTT